VSGDRSAPEWSDEAWRLAFTNAPIGCAIVALDGMFLQVNEALCRIVGYGADELATLTFQDITHPDDLEADLALVRALVAGDIPNYRMEKRYLRRDGSVVWINLTVSLVHNPDGTPAYFISQMEDIDQQRAANEAMRQSEAQLRSLTDSIQDAIIGSDLSGTIITWNAAAACMFGYSAEEAVGCNLTMLVPEARRAAETAALRRLAAGGKPRLLGQTVRQTAVRRDGTEFPVEITITAARDHEIRGYTAVVRDVSERDLFEEKAAILSVLLDNEDEAVVAFTLEGTVTTWNRGAERLYGYTAEEACGKRVGLLLLSPEEEQDCQLVEAARQVADGESVAYDGQRRRKDGSTVGVSVMLRPVVERGEVVGMVGITRVQ
jgi:PAS domain S-box-containing protein